MRLPPIALLGTLGCLSLAGPTTELPEGGSVLFVGNSLTYVNDLPQIVQALAAGGSGPAIEARMIAFPDYNLEDHLSRGDAVAAIRRGGWATVVLQQGPSTLTENRAQLRASARQLADEAAKVGARTALYAVWPTRDRVGDFPAADESYALAASDVNGTLLPVGEAWRAAWRRDASLALYAADGLHPSVTGSYLAGLVIAARLTGRSPVGMPRELRLAGGGRIEVPAALAATLQQAAAEALASR